MAVSVFREIDEVTKQLNNIGTVGGTGAKEIRALNEALKGDPENRENLNRKFEIYGERLDVARQRSEALKSAVAEYNAVAEEDRTPAQTRALKEWEEQQRIAEIQVRSLETAIANKDQTMQSATVTTNTMKGSMTEFNSILNTMNQVMRAGQSALKLFGADSATVTKQQNELNKQLKDGVITQAQYNEQMAGVNTRKNIADTMQKTMQLISIVKGAAAAYKLLTVMAGSAKSAMTMGIATAAIIAGIYAITVATNKAARDAGDTSTSLSGGEISSSSISTSSISTSNVPRVTSSVSGGTTTVQTLSQRQIEDAVHNAMTRVVLETGLNHKEFLGSAELNGREVVRFIFNDILSENASRGHPLAIS